MLRLPPSESFEAPDESHYKKYDRLIPHAESLRIRVAEDRLPSVNALQLLILYLHHRGKQSKAIKNDPRCNYR